MEKDTAEIVKELGFSKDFQTFYNENNLIPVEEKV